MYHLVHTNIATMLAAFHHPRMADWINHIEEIDGLARTGHLASCGPTPFAFASDQRSAVQAMLDYTKNMGQ